MLDRSEVPSSVSGVSGIISGCATEGTVAFLEDLQSVVIRVEHLSQTFNSVSHYMIINIGNVYIM